MRTITRCACLAIVALAVVALGSGLRAEDAWRTMTSSEKSFTVELPTAPPHPYAARSSCSWAPYTMQQYAVDRGDLAYLVWSATYPAEVNVAMPRDNLEGGLDNAAKGMEGGRWASINWVTHQGHLAVDAVGVRRGKAIRSFLVLKGRQIVSLTYAGPIGSAQSPDAARFIGSLKLDPTP